MFNTLLSTRLIQAILTTLNGRQMVLASGEAISMALGSLTQLYLLTELEIGSVFHPVRTVRWTSPLNLMVTAEQVVENH